MFTKEYDMQKTFINQLNSTKNHNELIHEEFGARFGNVDVVKVVINNKDSLSNLQIKILSDYQYAKITGYLHRKQSHNIKFLMDKTNYTYNSILSIINKLKKANIIEITSDKQFIISKNFEFPNLEFIAFELKLKNWKNAISQAMKNKSFSSYSYIVLPIELATKISKKDKDIFKLYNVGLIGMDKINYTIIYKPKIEKSTTRKNPTYISSLAKIILKENGQGY